jgi:hypothetical protein
MIKQEEMRMAEETKAVESTAEVRYKLLVSLVVVFEA